MLRFVLLALMSLAAPLVMAGETLEGRIYDAVGERFMSAEELSQRLLGADFVLLGETHDNPAHHRSQARALRMLVEAGERPAVAFEMIPHLMQEKVDGAADPQALAEAVEWEARGWPDFRHYRPIFEVAMTSGLPLLGANINRQQSAFVAREGDAAISEATQKALAWRPLTEAENTALEEEIFEAHCRQMPRRMMPAMVKVQRVKDAVMARTLLEAETRPVVLIAGSQHVRKDWGVPAYLAGSGQGDKQLVVAHLEVRPGRTEPQDYAAEWRGRLPFDVVIFTPAMTDREDPCKGLEERFSRHSK